MTLLSFELKRMSHGYFDEMMKLFYGGQDPRTPKGTAQQAQHCQ